MLNLPEWLKLVGLKAQNPFAHKQADHEREWLESVFVEHPAYNAMASEAEPQSSILHAARGAGKTTTCAMFERLCHEEAAHRQPLVVRFDEWLPLVHLLDKPPATQVDGHLTVLFEQIIYALRGTCDATWLNPPADPSLHQFLAWFCRTYGHQLTDRELDHLTRASRLLRSQANLRDTEQSRLNELQPLGQLHLLLRALREANIKTVYILVDRVDELAISVNNPASGADLLLPLLGNLQLLELDGLVVKCFIPSDIVAVLRTRGQLREDRISCYDLSWHGTKATALLGKLLQNRLSHFSQGAVQSMAALAATELRNLDDLLSTAAQGSPRQLLILGEQLILARTADATEQDLLIQPRHVRAVLGETTLQEASASQLAIAEHGQSTAPAERPVDESVTLTEESYSPRITRKPNEERGAGKHATLPLAVNAVPLLTLNSAGCVARGGEPIEGWQRLPTRQRDVLSYLFRKPDTLCSFKELGREVWNDEQVGDDTVRKVIDRLSKFLHNGLSVMPNPPYIEKVTGGRYILRHALQSTIELDPPDKRP